MRPAKRHQTSTEERDEDTIAIGRHTIIRRKIEARLCLDLRPTRTVQLLLQLCEYEDVRTVAKGVHLQIPVPVLTTEDVTGMLLAEVIGDVRRAKIKDQGVKETLIHLRSHRQIQVIPEHPLMEQEDLHHQLKDRHREDTRFQRRR